MNKGCPPNMISRRGYTRKNTGTQVKPACIRRTRTVNNTQKRQTRQAHQTHRLNSGKSCPPGMIPRSAYVRRMSSRVHKEGYNRRTKTGKIVHIYPKSNSVFVKSVCIKNVGKFGKSEKVIGPLRKGELRKYGYSYKLPDYVRRRALQRAIGATGPLDVYRKLNAVAKLSERAAPAASSSFAADRNWIHKTYANATGVLKAL